MLHPLASEIWLADGDVVAVAGFRYPTRMAVIRLGDGGLFIWSPTALSDALRAALEALGPVRFIIAPNTLHDLSIASWKAAYPDALLLAAPGLAERRRDIAFDGVLGDAPDARWADALDQVVVGGNAITTEVVFFQRAGGVVLVTDLIQNFPRGWFTGWRGVVARLDRLDAPAPEVPQKFRVAFTDRRAARAAIKRVLAWPAQKLVMAHGPVVDTDAQAAIARAFRWLVR